MRVLTHISNYIQVFLKRETLFFVWNSSSFNNREQQRRVACKHRASLISSHFQNMTSGPDKEKSDPLYQERKAELGSQSSSAYLSRLGPVLALAGVTSRTSADLEWSSLNLMQSLLQLALCYFFYFGRSWWRVPAFKICLLIPVFREIIMSCILDFQDDNLQTKPLLE